MSLNVHVSFKDILISILFWKPLS